MHLLGFESISKASGWTRDDHDNGQRVFIYVCLYTRIKKRKLARVILTFDQNINFIKKS